jgi:hypothetical protein
VIIGELLVGFAGPVAELWVDLDDEVRVGQQIREKIRLSSGFFLDSSSGSVTIDKKRLHRHCAGWATGATSLPSLRGYRLVLGVHEFRPRRLPVVLETDRMAV